MRFEATLPQSRGEALVALAQELGLSRSQLMDEALALFLKTVLEVKRGRRPVFIESTGQVASEFVSPSLAHLEWTNHQQQLELSGEEITRLAALLQDQPKPNEALLRAVAEYNK
jgi:hypothetical protein